jgi:hypothetical protein
MLLTRIRGASARGSLEPAARRRAGVGGVARKNAVGHQPVPDEQHEQRADGRADETRALVEPVPTDGLADEGCDERAGDPEPSRQYEAIQVVRTGRDETRDDAGDEADHDDPDNVRHGDLPGLALGSLMVARSGTTAIKSVAQRYLVRGRDDWLASVLQSPEAASTLGRPLLSTPSLTSAGD